MIDEGRITIDLARDGRVQLRSTRGGDVGALLLGREPAEALRLLAMLFSLCGRAHVAAARRAMTRPTDPASARRDVLLVLAENAREHLLRILTGWQSGDGPTLPAAPVMGLVDGMQAARDALGEQAEADRLSQFLAEHVLGLAPGRFLEIDGLDGLHEWLGQGQGAAARYIAAIIARGWQGFGATVFQPLPSLPARVLAHRLTAQSFAARPDWAGFPRETGPLARQIGHPLVALIVARHGAGLLSRLLARVVELAKIPDQMRDPEVATPGPEGLGVVETARGRLIHAAQQRQGRISSYRILAPTEWNFHPDGVAVQSLRNPPQTADLTQRAKALVAAIDPCVAFDVRRA